MRFSNILLALPLVGSVLAAPVAKQTSVVKKDVDVLAAVNALVSVVSSAGPLSSTSVEADVTAVLNVVVGGFNDCGSALGIDLSVGLDVDADVGSLLKKRDSNITEEVSQLLATVVQDVNGLVTEIADDVASIPAVAALLSQVDNSLGLILQGVDAILAGVLSLVAGILSDLGITLAPILTGVLGLLGGILGTVGSLVGGLL